MGESAGQPDTVVLAPNRAALRRAGASLALRAQDTYRWDQLGAFARADVRSVFLTHLSGSRMLSLRTVAVLARRAEDLMQQDRRMLRLLLMRGGTVVADVPVARVLAPGADRVVLASGAGITARRVPQKRGTLLEVGGAPVESVFTDANMSWAMAIWRLVLSQHAGIASSRRTEDARIHAGISRR